MNLEALGAFTGQVVSSSPGVFYPGGLGGEEAGNLRAEVSLEAAVGRQQGRR